MDDNTIICDALETAESIRQAAAQKLVDVKNNLNAALADVESGMDEMETLREAIQGFRKQFGCDEEPTY